VDLLVLYSSFGTIEYLRYPVFNARHKKTQIRIDILVLGLFYWGEKMVNKHKTEEALEILKTNNLLKKRQKGGSKWYRKTFPYLTALPGLKGIFRC